jgi:hypothetical protein
MSLMTSDAILDVLRGISTVASFSIAFNQVKNAWGEIFTGTCAHCHGAGSVICPRCSGTKDRRSRPAGVSVTALGFVDGPDFHHPCLWCGTNGPNDFEEEVSDDEDRAWAIRDDLALAMVNKPRRSDIEILAGTVACPQCCGKGQYQRHTPNFARFFGLQEPWQDEVALRLSTMYNGAENRPPTRPRQMLEYPGVPPPKPPRFIDQLPPPRDPEAEAQEDANALSGVMTGRDQLRADDYIRPYIDETDSDVED